MKNLIKWIILILILAGIIGYFAWRQSPSGYVFVPYNATALREGNVPTNAEQVKKLEGELVQFQNSLGAFTDPANQGKKLNTLALISEYQQMLGRNNEGKKTLETALMLQPNAKLLHAYAQLLFTMGAKEPAIGYITDAIKFAPETIELWRTKIEMLLETQKDNVSLLDAEYQKSIKATNSLEMITMYASYLGRQGRKEEAIQYWQKAQEWYPKNHAVYQQEIDMLSGK